MRTSIPANIFIALTFLITSCDAPPAETPARVAGAPVHGDFARGEAIVKKWCVTCHAVGPSALDQAPTLGALATNTAKTEKAVRAFLMAPHSPMPPLPLATQEIEDIIAFFRGFPPDSPPATGAP